MITEFSLAVVPHNLLHANHLRVILDRFGLVVEDAPLPIDEPSDSSSPRLPDEEPRTIEVPLEEAQSIKIMFSFLMEVSYDGTIITTKRFSGIYDQPTNPYEALKQLALMQFLDAEGNPLLVSAE